MAGADTSTDLDIPVAKVPTSNPNNPWTAKVNELQSQLSAAENLDADKRPLVEPPAQEQQEATPDADGETPPSDQEKKADEQPKQTARQRATIAQLRAAEEKAAAAERKAKENEALLQSALAALAGKSPPPNVAQSAKAETGDTIESLEAEQVALAEKFENGEILSQVDYVKANQAINRKIDALREKAFNERLTKATEAPVSVNELRQIDAEKDRLLEETVIGEMDGEQLALLESIARQSASANGKPYGKGASDTLRLLKDMERLAGIMAPEFGLKAATATPAPTAAPKSAVADLGAARLAKAAAHPPNTAAMGQAAQAGGITAEQYLAMSTSQRMKIPKAEHERIFKSVLDGR